MFATNDEPTEPLEPTKYPSSFDFSTNLCAIIYNVENPFFMIESNSLFSLACTISGSGSPYSSFALFSQVSFISSSAPGITGGHFSFDIGQTSSHISAILFGFVTTNSYAFSESK